METLPFSNNWNGKLNCDCFTTIRLHNPKKYYKGAQINVTLKGQPKGIYEVVDLKEIYLHQISNWIALLDTGYNAAETQRMIKNMYKNIPLINWETQLLSYVLLKKISNEQNTLDL